MTVIHVSSSVVSVVLDCGFQILNYWMKRSVLLWSVIIVYPFSFPQFLTAQYIVVFCLDILHNFPLFSMYMFLYVTKKDIFKLDKLTQFCQMLNPALNTYSYCLSLLCAAITSMCYMPGSHILVLMICYWYWYIDNHLIVIYCHASNLSVD